MSLARCKYCKSVIVQGEFCQSGCQILFEKQEAKKCCCKCNRELKDSEEEYCDDCRYRR